MRSCNELLNQFGINYRYLILDEEEILKHIRGVAKMTLASFFVIFYQKLYSKLYIIGSCKKVTPASK